MEHYIIAMGVTAGIYAIMALGMNVIWGMAGLFLAMPLMAVVRSVCAHVPDWGPWSTLMGTTEAPPDPERPASTPDFAGDFLEDTQLMDPKDAKTFFGPEKQEDAKR